MANTNLKTGTGLLQNAKNVVGWQTRRKIVVFSVDDYGNVRLDSQKARQRLDDAGLKCENYFDRFDSLEDEDDLTQLFDVLSSVKDIKGRHPVFTAFSLPANINFEKVIDERFQNYSYELLPETFAKLPGYSNVHQLWKEGMEKKLISPQFHGREHLNIKLLTHLFHTKDKEMLACFNNRSYTSLASRPFQNISYPSAFSFEEFSENEFLATVIADGVEAFKKVFGFRPTYFTAPLMQEHSVLHPVLKDQGINFIDAPMIKREHQGAGNYRWKLNYFGKTNGHGQTIIVRNCVFEPLVDPSIDWVRYCIYQINTAFRWRKPAIISSHRVNFAGHINPSNRRNGLGLLQKLLNEILHTWPEVEFMTASDLGMLVESRHENLSTSSKS